MHFNPAKVWLMAFAISFKSPQRSVKLDIVKDF